MFFIVSNYGTDWHVAQATISSPYRAFSKEKISANVGVKIGLNSVNITLQGEIFLFPSIKLNRQTSRLERSNLQISNNIRFFFYLE